MKNCPNCGRPTLRTEDWVCQWCGYPLLSKSYKKIPKTYREIKEESLSEWGISKGEQMSGEVSGPEENNLESMLETVIETEKTEEIEEEATEEYSPESEPEEEEESLTETGKLPKPNFEPTTKPEDEQVVNALPEEISELALEPTRKRARKPVRKAKTKPKTKDGGFDLDESEMELPIIGENESEQATITEPEIKKGVEIEGALGIEQGTVMETVSDQKIKDEVSVRPEQMDGKTPISVDELNLVFSGEKADTNTGLMGRTFQVAGVVDKIFLREHLDIRYIILVGARCKGIWDVRCTFEPEQSSALRRLAEGQKVIVQGEYEGQGRNSLFKNCAIIG